MHATVAKVTKIINRVKDSLGKALQQARIYTTTTATTTTIGCLIKIKNSHGNAVADIT
jgi:hypothetical protein